MMKGTEMVQKKTPDGVEEDTRDPGSAVQPLLKTHGGPQGTTPQAVTAVVFIFFPPFTSEVLLVKTKKNKKCLANP